MAADARQTMAARPVGDVDARHQEKRGRPRAPERAVGGAGCVEAGGEPLGASEPARPFDRGRPVVPEPERRVRSEEHTSELQSRLHLVCRLLLEKKKKKNNTTK